MRGFKIELEPYLREVVKYYFADFVRKGGRAGVPLKSLTPFAEKIRKGDEGTPQIRNLFLDQNQVFFEQRTQFLALLEEKILGKNP